MEHRQASRNHNCSQNTLNSRQDSREELCDRAGVAQVKEDSDGVKALLNGEGRHKRKAETANDSDGVVEKFHSKRAGIGYERVGTVDGAWRPNLAELVAHSTELRRTGGWQISMRRCAVTRCGQFPTCRICQSVI